MPRAAANGIDIEYETSGDPADPALLLVAGVGAQLVSWDDDFCARLAARGFHLVRYDNRDTGLSTKIDVAAPDLAAAATALLGGGSLDVPYRIEDMADDAAGLIDALGIAAAHVVGASMGGMIAQSMAIRHPRRVLSLCSIMSTPGLTVAGLPTDDAMAVLARPPAAGRAAVADAEVANHRIIGSPGFPFDEARIRRRAERAYDRCHHPDGVTRQLLALMASPDRTEALGSVTVPTLVIHGGADPLVAPDGGEATARAVPGARLLLVPGMGHDLPEPAWPAILDAIEANARKAVAV